MSAGPNHIVGNYLGNGTYLPSWSDPIININSDTRLQLDTIATVGTDYPFEIKGNLFDITNLPIENKTIQIFWDGEKIGETKTYQKGRFSLSYSFDEIGNYSINAIFEGEEHLNESNDNQTITVKNMGALLELLLTPDTIKRSEELTIKGILFSSEDTGMPDTKIDIYYNNEKVSSSTTDDNGNFEEKIIISEGSPLGEVFVRVIFKGDEIYGGIDAEEYITVESETILTLNSLEKENYKRNDTIQISGTLTDNYNEAVKNAQITIEISGYKQIVYTDLNGTFSKKYKIPNATFIGTYKINADFSGLDYYLPSENSISFKITDERIDGLLNNNILIIIAVVISVGIGGVVLVLIKKQDTQKGSQSIKEVAIKTIDQIKSGKDLRKAVIDCYDNLCKKLGATGLKKEEGKTPREFASDIKNMTNVSDDCLIALTQIFEKACYSEHEISIKERDAVIQCLNEILSSVNENIPTSEEVKEK